MKPSVSHNWSSALTAGLEKLAYTIRTLRLTHGDEALRQRASEEIVSSWKVAFDRLGSLELEVSAYHLSLRGNTVYQEFDRAESLSFRLFRSGVKSLHLSPQITPEEVATLATLIATRQDTAEQLGTDLVTRLWAAPLPCVHVTERSWHALRLLEPHNNDANLLRAYASDAVVFFDPLESDIGTHPTQAQSVEEASIFWGKMTRKPAPSTRPSRPFSRSGTFDPMVPQTDIHQALAEFSSLIRDAIRARTSQDEEELAALFQSSIRSLLLFGDQTSLEETYLDLLKLQQERPERAKLASEIMARGCSAQSMRHLLLSITSNAPHDDHQWVPSFFARYTQDPPAAFCPLFALNITGQTTKLLTTTLWSISGPDLELWTNLLDEVPPDLGLEFLDLLSQSEDQRFLFKLNLHLSNHANPEIRSYAVRQIPLGSEKRLRSTLVDSLKDPSSAVRVATIEQMAASKDPSLGIFLVDQIRSKDFPILPQREQKTLLMALLKLGKNKYLRLILSVLQRLENQLSSRAASNDTILQNHRTCALLLEALGNLPTEACKVALVERLPLAPLSLRDEYNQTIRTIDETLRPSFTFEDQSEAPWFDAETLSIHGSHIEEVRPDPPPLSKPTFTQSAVTTTPESNKIDALLAAYVQDDTSLLSMLAPQSGASSADPVPPVPEWTSPEADVSDIDNILRDYLSSSPNHGAVVSEFTPTNHNLSDKSDFDPSLSHLSHFNDLSEINVPPLSTDESALPFTEHSEIEIPLPEDAENLSDLPFSVGSALHHLIQENTQLSEPISYHTPPTLPELLSPSSDEDAPDSFDELLFRSSFPPKEPGPLSPISSAPGSSQNPMEINGDASWMERLDDPELNDEVAGIIDDLMQRPPSLSDLQGAFKEDG